MNEWLTNAWAEWQGWLPWGVAAYFFLRTWWLKAKCRRRDLLIVRLRCEHTDTVLVTEQYWRGLVSLTSNLEKCTTELIREYSGGFNKVVKGVEPQEPVPAPKDPAMALLKTFREGLVEVLQQSDGDDDKAELARAYTEGVLAVLGMGGEEAEGVKEKVGVGANFTTELP